jgi:hypothetical protein
MIQPPNLNEHMQLQQAVDLAFTQLSDSLDRITPEQYRAACRNLSDVSIGQHVRHIIEMFRCLEKGYQSGILNYELRERDPIIESEKDLALIHLSEISKGLGKPDRELFLEGAYCVDAEETIRFHTNYHREVLYNLEHTIHHMALIRVGLKELAPMDLPDGFGVASSTVKHKNTCAQ